jgi:hypothetical protein
MEAHWRSLWIRWTLVFFLLSFGFSILFGGLDLAARDSEPVMFFIGYWISQAIFVVVPGIVVGGIIALASSKPILGGKVMIAVNSIIAAMIIGSAIL